MRNRAHEVAEYFETIVDEVGSPELPAYCGLFVALTAEEHLIARNTCRTEEATPLEPIHQHRLSRLVAPRHQPDALSEPLLGEPCNSLASALNLRRRGVAMGSHGLGPVIFADTVDDDAPDIDPERFGHLYAHPPNAVSAAAGGRRLHAEVRWPNLFQLRVARWTVILTFRGISRGTRGRELRVPMPSWSARLFGRDPCRRLKRRGLAPCWPRSAPAARGSGPGRC